MSVALSASLGRFLAEVGRTLGKAIVAGVGMEIAKVVGSELQSRLVPRSAARDDAAKSRSVTSAASGDDAEAENERLRAELHALRQEVEMLKRLATPDRLN